MGRTGRAPARGRTTQHPAAKGTTADRAQPGRRQRLGHANSEGRVYPRRVPPSVSTGTSLGSVEAAREGASANRPPPTRTQRTKRKKHRAQSAARTASGFLCRKREGNTVEVVRPLPRATQQKTYLVERACCYDHHPHGANGVETGGRRGRRAEACGGDGAVRSSVEGRWPSRPHSQSPRMIRHSQILLTPRSVVGVVSNEFDCTSTGLLPPEFKRRM